MSVVELETEQAKKAEEHKLKIQHEEEKLKRLQQERQAAFDDAFQSYMQVYKQTGAVTSKFVIT